jgi:hypothetical protein
MKCSCTSPYTKINKPRILITCGHTYCEKCLLQFVQSVNSDKIISCPKDKHSIRFTSI